MCDNTRVFDKQDLATEAGAKARGLERETTMNKTVNETIQDMLTKDERDRLLGLDAECSESSAYERFIDNLDSSAKVKRVLRELARKTAYVGGRVIRIGKIALDFTIKALGEVCRRFPNTACAVLILLILKALISLIPFIGGFLAGVLTPILLTVVVGVGLAKDVFEMVRPSAARHFNFSTASER